MSIKLFIYSYVAFITLMVMYIVLTMVGYRL